MSKEDFVNVTMEELWNELSGSTKFGKDELIEMISYQDDHGKDFCIYHRHKAFRVPLHKIREYFTRHKKPVPPMTKDQELVYLREKVEKLQAEVDLHQAEGKLAKPASSETEALAEGPEEDTKVAEEVEFEAPAGQDAPVAEKEEPPTPPKRDDAIPPANLREKKSLKDIRKDLAVELKDAKSPKKKLGDTAVPKDVKGREELVDALVKKK